MPQSTPQVRVLSLLLVLFLMMVLVGIIAAYVYYGMKTAPATDQTEVPAEETTSETLPEGNNLEVIDFDIQENEEPLSMEERLQILNELAESNVTVSEDGETVVEREVLEVSVEDQYAILEQLSQNADLTVEPDPEVEIVIEEVPVEVVPEVAPETEESGEPAAS